jgi:hypothetical protein
MIVSAIVPIPASAITIIQIHRVLKYDITVNHDIEPFTLLYIGTHC